MLLDQNAVLSDGQEITASAASQNVIDLGAAGNAVPGALFAVCRVDEAFSGLTGLTVSLQTSDASAFTAPAELASVTLAAAELGADGKIVFAAAVPAGLQRYLRAYYTVTGTATAGKISFFLTDAVDMK